MNVLQLAADFSEAWGGGVYETVVGLSRELGKHCRIQILASAAPGNEKPVPAATVFSSGGKYQFSFAIKTAIDREIPKHDLVHIHGLWQFPLSYAAWCARCAGVPYVYHVHGMLNPWPIRHHALRKQVYGALIERANLNAASAVICVSKKEEASVRAFGVTAPTAVIPNGILRETMVRETPKGTFRSRHRFSSDQFLILFLGRIHPKKGIDLLLEAFDAIHHRFARAHVLIAGPEEDRRYAAQLKRWVRAHDLEKSVTFLGPVFGEEKNALLADSNLFVLPSRDEGFSIAVLEAMAAGLPVVITKACGFNEIEQADAGFVVEGTAEKLAGPIEQLVQDEWHACRMGISGKNLVLSRYTWETVGGEMFRLYETILSKR